MFGLKLATFVRKTRASKRLTVRARGGIVRAAKRTDWLRQSDDKSARQLTLDGFDKTARLDAKMGQQSRRTMKQHQSWVLSD